MPEQGPAVISPKLYVKIPNVTGLYRHTKSGRYYGVKNIKGKRKERSLGTTDRAAYAYDFENRLVGLAKTISGTGIITGTYAYMYDYRTRRVLRDETGAGGVKTQLVFSAGTNVQEYTLSGTSGTLAVEYIRGSDYGGGVGGILYTLRGSGQRYTHENRRGDVVAKTDGTGSLRYQAAYEAFGKRPQEAGSTQDRQKANTKDEDPTGLLNEGFRYRDLDTGSFITKDPAGMVDGPNRYTYVRQNPWTKFDPEGLREQNDDEKAALPKMHSMEHGLREHAKELESQALAAKKAGNDALAKEVGNSAKAEFARANGLATAISEIEGAIKNSNTGTDPANLRTVDQAFKIWNKEDPHKQSPYSEEGWANRSNNRFAGADKCNIFVFDVLTGAHVVDPKALTISDTGNPIDANYYNRDDFMPRGLSSGKSQYWDGSGYSGGKEPQPGDVVSYGDPRGDYAHATISLGGGWHIGASQAQDEAFGQKAGVNINTDEYEHAEKAYPNQVIRTPQ